MKQMTCKDMGGSCDTMLQGSTAEEMTMNGMKHIEAAHPDQAAMIKAMSKEDTDKWMADFKVKFDALPDMPQA